MKAKVYVSLRPSVLDPQGKAIEGAVHSLGFEQVQGVRQGKFFDIDLNTSSKDEAQKILETISEKLLSNPVIEDFRIEMIEGEG